MSTETSTKAESPVARLQRANAARKAAGLPVGRPPGTPNKLTSIIRSAVGDTFERMGGTEGLLKWAESNPDRFYELCMKLLPKELEANSKGAGITVVVNSGRAQLRDEKSGNVLDVESTND